MKSFVSLSGGIDSTYLLWKLLAETSDEVTAFHIDLTNVDHSFKIKYDTRSFDFHLTEDATSKVVNSIVAWLKQNVRDFTFLSEPMNEQYLVPDWNVPNNPPAYILRYAIDKINSNQIDRVCLSSEWENDGGANGGTVTTRRTGAWVAHEFFLEKATRGRIDFTLLDMDYNQSFALAEMPQALQNIILSSRSEEHYKSIKTKYFQELLAEGKTPKECGDIAKARCILSNGKWLSMKHWLTNSDATDKDAWDMPTWPTSYEVPSSG